MSHMDKPTILDTDVVSVLFSVGSLTRLLSIWPHDTFFITSQTREEVKDWRKQGEILISELDHLESQGIIQTIAFDESSEDEITVYANLMLTKKLGKGESASIAIAQHLGYDVASNDNIARGICSQLFPEVRTIGSGSILNNAISAGLIPKEEGEIIRQAMDQYFT